VRPKWPGLGQGKILRCPSWFIDDHLVPEHEDLFAYYAGQDEGQRLFRFAHNRLELLRTRELLQRQLPLPPAVVLDVGGGTGVHAAWLGGRGYRVHLPASLMALSAAILTIKNAAGNPKKPATRLDVTACRSIHGCQLESRNKPMGTANNARAVLVITSDLDVAVLHHSASNGAFRTDTVRDLD
jgi:hypothetical protein